MANSLWVEQKPSFFVMMPNGVMNVTMKVKVGDENRLRVMNMTLMLTVNPLVKHTADTNLNLTLRSVYALNAATVMKAVQSGTFEWKIDGFPADTTKELILIPIETLEEHLKANFIDYLTSIQHTSVVWKKIEIRLFYSQEYSSISAGGSLTALREYECYRYTCNPSLKGKSTYDDMPYKGAITIAQYPDVPLGTAANKVLRKQQDKPGRFLIRGSNIPRVELNTNNALLALVESFRVSRNLGSIGTFCLTPVVDVLGDLWSVRAALATDPVKVAGQGKQSARARVKMDEEE